MRRLILSSILITGLAMTGAAGAISAEQMGYTQSGIHETENTQQKMNSESLNQEGQEYTVKSGDSHAGISEEYLGTSDNWEIIAEANGIESPDQLEVGQTIIIPAADVRSEAGINSGEHAYTGQNADVSMNWESEMKGEVTDIASGNDSLTITDENGASHSLKLEDSEILDGVSVGDFVKVELDGDTVISLEKVEKKS